MTEFCSHQRNTVCPVWCVQGLCGSKTFNMIQKWKGSQWRGGCVYLMDGCELRDVCFPNFFEPNILWQTVWVSVSHWMCVNVNLNILNPREELQFKLSKCQQRRCSAEWWTKEISECRKVKTIKPVVKLSNRTRPVCSINLKSCEILFCVTCHTPVIFPAFYSQ